MSVVYDDVGVSVVMSGGRVVVPGTCGGRVYPPVCEDESGTSPSATSSTSPQAWST